MNLKSLVHRELGEGLTVEELASTVGVSVRTIEDILTDELPQDPVIWELCPVFSHSCGFSAIRWSATLRRTIRP